MKPKFPMLNAINSVLLWGLLFLVNSPRLIGQEPPTQEPVAASAHEKDETGFRRPDPPDLVELPAELEKMLASGTALNPQQTVFLSKSRESVLLRTQVACSECLLEMLCYNEPAEKGHESLLWIRANAKVIHMALLATGSKPGEPATFSPEFKPPSGPIVDVYLNWVDQKGKPQRAKAQTWMRHSVSRYYSVPMAKPPMEIEFPYLELRYDPYNNDILWYGHMSEEQRDGLLEKCHEKTYQAAIRKFHKDSQPTPMEAEFVFCGSYHYTIEETGEKVYAAEAGYVICVANFAGALIDVTEASSASDGGRSFEAWPGRVPPRDTPVIVELIPAKITPKVETPKTPTR